jgi:hypothetical protein
MGRGLKLGKKIKGRDEGGPPQAGHQLHNNSPIM